MKIFWNKTLANICIIFVIISSTFFLMSLIPGDPVDFISQDSLSLKDKNSLLKDMGLNEPLWKQYLHFIWNIFHLNLGTSIHTGESITQIILQQFPFTFFLSFLALFMAFIWGIPAGLFSAHPKFSKFRQFFDLLPMIFFSIPVFISAPLLIWFFGIYLSWLPVSGAGSLSYIFLPALSLALPLGAVLMQITQSSILELLSSDFIRTARSKGLSFSQIYFKHVLKNAFIPILTVLGLQLGSLLTGTVIIEHIFDRPGIGSLLYKSIVSRDYPLIQALILCIAIVYIFINRWTDWLYVFFQPRIQASS